MDNERRIELDEENLTRVNGGVKPVEIRDDEEPVMRIPR